MMTMTQRQAIFHDQGKAIPPNELGTREVEGDSQQMIPTKENYTLGLGKAQMHKIRTK